MEQATIGIIGGSGLYDIEGVKIVDEVSMDTAWGAPSDNVIIAEIEGVRAAFLPRHGRGHVHLPMEINNRANIAALKMMGVRQVIAFSAVGSLTEMVHPLDFVVPDQMIDRTRVRAATFFGNGVAAHVAFAHPFCDRLRHLVSARGALKGVALHDGGTLLCMEGPAFSTRAESELYRAWGAQVINMSSSAEAKLAREAEMCYAVVCMATDYDCWKEDEEHVTVDMLIANLNKNGENAKSMVKTLVPAMAAAKRDCGCGATVGSAIITAPEKRNPEQVHKLRTILPEYF